MEICFVCTANICRSPFAEVLLRARLQDLPGVVVYSRGLYAAPGHSAPPESQRICQRMGLEIAGHRSRRFDAAEARSADLIFAMNAEQVGEIRDELGEDAPVYVLSDFAPGPHNPGYVPDPYGAGSWAYETAFTFIEDCVLGVERWLRAGRPPLTQGAPGGGRPPG